MMQLINKADFLERSKATLAELYDMLADLPVMALADLQASNTALVLVDLINGFARTGALQSPRVEALIPGVVRLLRAGDQMGFAKVVFTDNHSEESPEFASYPVHCLAGSIEAEPVDEIKAIENYQLFPKNSTNGFLEAAFQKWLEENSQINTFIVVGDCTDICIQQFAVTLKAWFNQQNRRVRVIVPIDLVDTYDLGLHNADLLNVVTLFSMMGNGIEAVKAISLPNEGI